MPRHKSSSRKRLSEEQISEMVRMRRQGEPIEAIAQAIGCHRQTVRLHLQEKRGDILADEVRKQLLIDELRRHLDDLTQFGNSLVHYLRVPTTDKDEGDAEAALTPLWGKERQTIRRNKMLLESLRQHTGEKGWWVAFKEWQETWNACKRAREEIQSEAYEVVRKCIEQKPDLKQQIEKQSGGGKDKIGVIVDDILWVVWWAGTNDMPMEQIKFRIEGKKIETDTGPQTSYQFQYQLSDTSLEPEVLALCELSFGTAYENFKDKGICEMLDRMREKVDKVADALDPSVLRPQILRSRCDLCPA